MSDETCTYSCGRCGRRMHPAQNCRRAPDGIICMACYAPELPGERTVREMDELEAWYRAHPRSRPERGR